MRQTDRLRRFIERQGTQAQFAEKMSLRRETVSRAVSGSEPISPLFKVRFQEVFGLDAYAEVFTQDACPSEAAA